MIWLLICAAALWFMGIRLGVARGVLIAALTILAVAVLAIQLTLPADNALRKMTGGSARNWLIMLALLALVGGYTGFVRRARQRHKDNHAHPAPVSGTFSGAELDRYKRHIILREIGGPGQKKLKTARVLVVGAGGLGAPALQYLAAAGVGTIGVIDDDIVEASNLQRQVIHTDAQIDKPKVFSAQEAMLAQNPFIEIRPYNRRLTREIAADLFEDFDLILDGTDDPDTRYLVNETAVRLRKPLISGAISQWEGQVSLFDPANGTPCYACIFPNKAAAGLAPSCAEAGVIGALPGVIGSMMALEAIKHLTGAGDTLKGRMLIYDGLYSESRIIGLKSRDECTCCGKP